MARETTSRLAAPPTCRCPVADVSRLTQLFVPLATQPLLAGAGGGNPFTFEEERGIIE